MKKSQNSKVKLNSFDKSFSSDVFLKKPEKYREIEQFCKETKNIITMGSNYSYSPLSLSTDSLVLDIKKFNRILYFDKKKKEVTVEGGTKIYELLNFTLNYNLWIPQLPGYPYISLGGAVATNAHGKSCGLHGTIKKSVKKILLYHKTHGWLNLSEKENKEIFELTIGGLGLTGTIVSITFNLTEFIFTEFLTKKKKISSISDIVKNFNVQTKKKSHMYSWNTASDMKNFGQGFIFESTPRKNSNKISKIKAARKNTYNFPICFWNKYTIKAVNKIYFKILDSKEKETNESFTSAVFPFVGKENYFKLFGTKGFIESQLIVPNYALNDFLVELEKICKVDEPLITLLSFKIIRGDQKLIRFEGNGTCVTLDLVNNQKNQRFLQKIDKLCIEYKVLPSIIKDSRLSKNIFDQCYTEAEEFREQLLKFDKNRVYQSEISHKFKL